SLSSPGARKDVRDGSKMLATLSRYSTAPADAGNASATHIPTATAASMDRSVTIEPPDFGIVGSPESMPSGGSRSEESGQLRYMYRSSRVAGSVQPTR